MVTNTTKITLGILSVIITATLITIMNTEHGLKMDILKNESNFYIYDGTNWTLSATESWKLYTNGKYYKPSSVTLKNTVLKENQTKVVRTSKYKSNATIIDIYIFDGNNKDITMFPVTHTINITKCPSCKYVYDYKIYSDRMKIDADYPDLMIGKTLTYEINNERLFNIRLYDPLWNISGNITKNVPSLDPQNATSINNLYCSVYADFRNFTNVTYSNGTNYSITFWYLKNSVVQTAYTASSINYNYTPVVSYAPRNVTEYLTRGDVWQCRVRYATTSGSTPAISPLLVSAENIIINSIPNITSRDPVDQGSAYAQHARVVTLTWTGSDADTRDVPVYYVYGYIGE